MTEIVLASESRYRRDLMQSLGVPFRSRAAACDEEALKDPSMAPRELAEFLAVAKAKSLADLEPNAIVIGSDQVIALGPLIFSKPGNRNATINQLRVLAGHTHDVFTAVAVWHRGAIEAHTETARMSMRALTEKEIEEYVALDAAFDCAGGYRLESRGAALFERIDCADHSAIVGLPLVGLTEILKRRGVVPSPPRGEGRREP